MAKIFALAKGSSVTEEIIRIAAAEGIRTATVEAIGGVDRLTIAYYNREKRSYDEHRYEEFLEVTSLFGNLTTRDERPFLHVHGNFGRRDMSVIGGHVISASVFPTLEAVLTPTTNIALRRLDEETRLTLIFDTSQGQ
jgi:hypothetical protein